LSRGICYVAFGEQYDYQCAYSVLRIRKYSDIPVFVITNLKRVCSIWGSLKNVEMLYLPDTHRKENRYYKVRMDLFSPFDISLYCDTDTIVQSDKFLRGFDVAEHYDAMFSVYSVIREMEELPMVALYGKFIRKEELPQVIYKDGVFFFQKIDSVRRLFEQWEYYWRELGEGRDMPALFPAVARAEDLDVGILPVGWDDRDGKTVVHAFGDYKVEGLPLIKKYKPFDRQEVE